MPGVLDFLSQAFGGGAQPPVPPPDSGNFMTTGTSVTGQTQPAPQNAAAQNQPSDSPTQLYQPDLLSDPAGHFTVRNFLGNLGDALLRGSGHQPVYAPRIQAQQQASAISQFLADPNPVPSPEAISRLAKFDPDMASQMYERAQAARMAMVPKYTKDDSGNIWKESFGQSPVLVSKGPGKIVDVQPGHAQTAVNPYGLAGADGAAAPAGMDTGAAAPNSPDAQQAPTLPGGDDVAAHLLQSFPGSEVTSGKRTLAQNEKATGVTNSAHLSNTPTRWARDLKGGGVDTAENAAAINALGIPGLKALYEGPGHVNSTGPHLHVQFIAPNGTGAPQSAPASAPQGATQFSRVVAQGPAAFRPLTGEEKQQYPGATYMTPEGPHYAPVGSVPIDASDPGIRAAGAAMAEGKAMPAGRDQQSMRAIRDSAVTYLQNKYPGMTPEQAGAKLVQNEQDYNSGNTALKAWSSGKQSQTLDSINNVYGHLQAYKQLADALKSGDVRLINAAKNAAGTAFGQSGPMELQEVTQILGPEMEKVVAGAQGGTESERSGWAKSFAAANSPAQAAGVVNTATGLLARRLQSANLAYKNSTHRDDFTDRLLPDVASFYQSVPKAAGQQGGAKAPPNVIRYDSNGNRVK